MTTAIKALASIDACLLFTLGFIILFFSMGVASVLIDQRLKLPRSHWAKPIVPMAFAMAFVLLLVAVVRLAFKLIWAW